FSVGVFVIKNAIQNFKNAIQTKTMEVSPMAK
ncbi:unnamed protein product, partial [marine sediment metagenome]